MSDTWDHMFTNIFNIFISSKQLADKQAVSIASKIADGVHYMHSQDPIVIHQDLKPLNVLVSEHYWYISSESLTSFSIKF